MCINCMIFSTRYVQRFCFFHFHWCFRSIVILRIFNLWKKYLQKKKSENPVPFNHLQHIRALANFLLKHFFEKHVFLSKRTAVFWNKLQEHAILKTAVHKQEGAGDASPSPPLRPFHARPLKLLTTFHSFEYSIM